MAKPDWVTLNKNSGAYNEQVDVSVITYTGRVNRGGALDIVTVDGSPVASEVVDLAQDSPGLMLVPYVQILEVDWNGGSFANVMEWATNAPSVIGGAPTAGSTWVFVYNGSTYPVATGIVFPGDPGLVGLVTGKFNVTIPASNLLADRNFSLPMSTTLGSGDLTRTFTVKQTGRPAYLVLEPESLSSEAYTAHTSSFTIKCNDDLVWSQLYSLPAWMTLAKSSGTGGTSNSITVQQNDYLAARSYVLLFKQTGGDEVQKSFPVTQVGAPLRVSFNPTSQELEYDDLTEKTVNVSTNPDNAWTINSKPDWIDITSGGSGATGDGVIKYKANQSNPNTTPRTSSIVLRNSTGVLTGFEITQKKLPAFVNLSPTSFNFGATGSSFTITVDCAPGVPWTATLNKGTLTDIVLTQSSGTGPGYIFGSCGNNTKDTAGAGSIVVTQLTESATCTINQVAGVKVYSEITITAYNYPTATAAGGTILPNYGYSQTWTWNGTGTPTTITTGASLSFSGGSINTSNGAASVTSKGTNISNQTTFTTGTMTVRMNGKSKSASAAVPQAGNYVTGISVSGGGISYANIGAGATSANPTLTGFVATFTFSSGSTTSTTPSTTYGTLSSSQTYSLSPIQNGFTAINSTNGVLTATHRGTTIGAARTSGTVTRNIVVTWTPTSGFNAAGTKTASIQTTATCTQNANAVSGYDPAVITTFTYPDIPASGGTVSPNGYAYRQTRYYSSGSSDYLTSGGTIIYSNGTGQVSASSLGTTATSSRTLIYTMTSRVDMNGVTGTNSSVGVYQAINNWWDNDIVLNTVSTNIPAYGGSVTLSWNLYRKYASGDRQNVGQYGTLSGSATGFSISGAVVTAASRGTTVGDVRGIWVTATYAGINSNSVLVLQEANAVRSEAAYASLSYSPSYFPYTGGTGYPSLSVNVTTYYTSNATSSRAGSISSTSYSVSGADTFSINVNNGTLYVQYNNVFQERTATITVSVSGT